MSSDQITPGQAAITAKPGDVWVPPEAIDGPFPSVAKLPHPGFWWSVLWCVGFLLVSALPAVFIAVAILLVLAVVAPQSLAAPDGQGSGLLDAPAGRWLMAAVMIVEKVTEVIVALVVIRLVVGRGWSRQLAIRRPAFAHVVLAAIGLLGVMVIVNVALGILRPFLPDLKGLGLPDVHDLVGQLVGSWPLSFSLLVIAVVPGIAEELWCRGFLGRGLVGRYGVVLGVVLTSFLFGLIHVEPVQGLFAMVMGLYLHFVYLTTRSLWVPILIHAINNALAVLAERIPVLTTLDNAATAAPPYLLVAAVVLGVGATWTLYQSRARLAPMDTGPAVWKPSYPGVAYPPKDSGMTVVTGRPTAATLAILALGVAGFAGSWVFILWGK